jgi:hypothetical protein
MIRDRVEVGPDVVPGPEIEGEPFCTDFRLLANQLPMSVGDGLYAFVNPLPVGVHTLEFGGVFYTVTVSPH